MRTGGEVGGEFRTQRSRLETGRRGTRGGGGEKKKEKIKKKEYGNARWTTEFVIFFKVTLHV